MWLGHSIGNIRAAGVVNLTNNMIVRLQSILFQQCNRVVTNGIDNLYYSIKLYQIVYAVLVKVHAFFVEVKTYFFVVKVPLYHYCYCITNITINITIITLFTIIYF